MESALETYLASHLPGAPGVTVSNLFRIPGGASRETWMFDAAWSENGEPRSAPFIVRKDPPGSLVESDREVEYAFYSAFGGNPIVPVPGMRWLEKDPQHLGAPFFIMDRILGCEANPRLIQTQPYDESRPTLAKRFYEILAAIATSDDAVAAVSKLVPVPMPETAWSHELDYWEGMIDANEMGPQPIARAAIRWLRANPPPPAQRVSAVHGDYRVGNFLYRPDGIYGVVDWEMAHLGDPLEDLSWWMLDNWRYDRERPGLIGAFFPREEFVAHWERASGLTADEAALRWWTLLSHVKANAIWITAGHRFALGETGDLAMPVIPWVYVNQQEAWMLAELVAAGGAPAPAAAGATT